ncbi:GNAT family N-acetyltransferase [Azospirillum sp. HJ39]|uniref:GNAT family N-acetyltransferase n=1 Tax=Azospirillum sp. HJ39 TaxID=3159496 RepID=UPI00355858A0
MTLHADVRDNAAQSRYELTVDGATAVAVYELRDGEIVFTHTEVPKSLSGQGVASALAKGALEDVRARGLKAVPLCSFFAGFIERHPEFHDLVR